MGHSAVGSVADTMSTFAPLLIAAWMAGIWEAGVAAVPLVSVPVSPSAVERGDRAAGLRAVGGGEVVVPEVLRDDEDLKARLQRAARRAEEVDAAEDEVVELTTSSNPRTEHAASRTDAMTRPLVSQAVCLSFISESFQ